MQTRIPFTDRLRDRGLIDQWSFFLFAAVGGVAIFSAKWLNVPPRWVLIGALAAMLFYAVLVGVVGTGRLRGDQAGDNCYYLGLIYTLASLSYAIATFDPNDPASTIVQGFGIALGTTILGLILRVFFNQGRPDMENVEEIARMELTEAVARLKRELSSVVLHMNDLGRQLDQSMREVHDAATKSMQAFANSSVQGIQSVASVASDAIRAEANDFAGRSKRYDSTFNNLLSKLDDHSERIAGLNASHDALISVARLASEAAISASDTVGSVTRSAERATSAIASIETAATSATSIVQELLSATTDFESTLKAIGTETKQQLSDLGKGPSDTIRSSMESLQNATRVLQNHIENLSRAHDEASTAAVEVTRKHNDELEIELKRSRDVVARVHSALADMTRNLAETVERR